MAQTFTRNFPQPDPPAGYACLQSAFGNLWQTAENLARALSYEVRQTNASQPWLYVPSAAVAAVNQKMADGSAAYQEARAIDSTYISCQIVDPYLCFSTRFYAQQLGLPVKKPSESEDEYFVLISDLPAIVARCRSDNPGRVNGARNSQDVQDGVVEWAGRNGPGLTRRACQRALRAH